MNILRRALDMNQAICVAEGHLEEGHLNRQNQTEFPE